MHEIGHAIGLDHSDVEASVMWAAYMPFMHFDAPTADDIAGVQFLYGAPLVVPLPAALPLFGSAVLVMGFMGWRKRRKAAA